MLDFLKTNFDGAMLGEVDEAGIGMVICNSMGEVMTALSEKIQKPPSMEILELLAVRRAVRFTLEVGLQQSIFEGDSEFVINSLCGLGMLNSQVGHIIKDILSLANSFQNYSFSHIIW